MVARLLACQISCDGQHGDDHEKAADQRIQTSVMLYQGFAGQTAERRPIVRGRETNA